MVYGATGFTGRLITLGLRAQGVSPVLGGRNRSKLRELGRRLDLDWRAAPLDDPGQLDAALADVDVVLHTAGPFSHTARPMVEACLRTGTHYLDVAGEAPPIESLAKHDAEARRCGIMIMPAVGFDVVPSDCLAAHVARRLPGARHLAIGIAAMGFLTPGSAKAFLAYAGEPVRVRRGGKLTGVPPGAVERSFDFGQGSRRSSAMSWGDTATAFYTTGIPNITTYFELTPRLRAALSACLTWGRMLGSGPAQAVMQAFTDMLPDGPTEEQRRSRRMAIVAEAEDAAGRRVASRLHTPESYTFTSMTAPRIARRVAEGDLEVGFQTPGRVYGPDFVLDFDEVSREDLPC
jgi:short subunit dehydrogenase-like uncharacterized protein